MFATFCLLFFSPFFSLSLSSFRFFISFGKILNDAFYLFTCWRCDENSGDDDDGLNRVSKSFGCNVAAAPVALKNWLFLLFVELFVVDVAAANAAAAYNDSKGLRANQSKFACCGCCWDLSVSSSWLLNREKFSGFCNRSWL